MPTAIVTGSGGLIGSESVNHFVQAGYGVVGLENDMRARFFGSDASTAGTTAALSKRYPREAERSSSTSATPRGCSDCSPSTRGSWSW